LQSKFKGWKIYYYAAVNWVVGPVYIKLMSGSKGAGWKTTFTVS
jgi:hypothetical protein